MEVEGLENLEFAILLWNGDFPLSTESSINFTETEFSCILCIYCRSPLDAKGKPGSFPLLF